MFWGRKRNVVMSTRCAFHMGLYGAANSHISGVGVVTSYNAVRLDTHSGANASAGTYTVPIEGVWTLAFFYSTDDGDCGDLVIRNNTSAISEYVVSRSGTSSIYWATSQIAVDTYLNVGDVLDVYVPISVGFYYNCNGGFLGQLQR